MKELDKATTRLLLAVESKPKTCHLRHVVLWVDGDANKAAAWSALNGIPVSVIASSSGDLKKWKIDPTRSITTVLAQSHRTIGIITSVDEMDAIEFDARFLLCAARALKAEHRYTQSWGMRALKYFKPSSEEVLTEVLAGIQDDIHLDDAGRTKILAYMGSEAQAAFRVLDELSKMQITKATDPFLPILRDHRIEVSVRGFTTFLRDLDPKRVSPLIKQLVDNNFAKRQEAMRRLIQMPIVPDGLLKSAASGKDPELAWRAKQVLKQRGTVQQEQLVFAVLQTIRSKRTRIPTETLFDVIALLKEDHLIVAARRALVETAKPQDASVIRAALASRHATQRAAAVMALSKVLGNDARKDIESRLEDSSDWVRLACAISLAELQDRRSLEQLVALLSADEYRIRARSVQLLQDLTGIQFGFLPADTPDRRKLTVLSWQEWIADKGRVAELRLPLQDNSLQPHLSGRFLLAIKGECQLFVNGRRVLSTSGGNRRQSVEISLTAGDVIVARIRSRWVYRAIRVSFVSTDRKSVVSFRRNHFRHVDNLEVDAVDVAAVTTALRQPRPGRPDNGYKRAWSNLNLANDDSQWMWGWKKNSWHQIACVVSPTMFKSINAEE